MRRIASAIRRHHGRSLLPRATAVEHLDPPHVETRRTVASRPALQRAGDAQLETLEERQVVAPAAADDLAGDLASPADRPVVAVALEPAARLEAAPERVAAQAGLAQVLLGARQARLAVDFVRGLVGLDARDLLVQTDLLQTGARGVGGAGLRREVDHLLVAGLGRREVGVLGPARLLVELV